MPNEKFFSWKACAHLWPSELRNVIGYVCLPFWQGRSLGIRFNMSIPDTSPIWRYMNAFELLSIFHAKTFVMRSYQSLVRSDSMEGKLPWVSFDEDFLRKDAEKMQGNCFVSCWHLQEEENALLWRLYAPRGFAVKTTIRKLSAALNRGLGMEPGGPAPLFCSAVSYEQIDQTHYIEEISDALRLLARKRASFASEMEYRFIAFAHSRGASVINKDHGGFLEIPIEANSWIDGISVDPSLAKWAISPLKQLVEAQGIQMKTSESC